ncbi:hypothetical protein TrispH2_011644 [Trichoplax sp. H2]|nr:hypothetical protein TrispH2_011644 [Trichoplax sp. H2]|eukprot:RDD36346.1 hypothetical protein TrispH2_011644 [Trichoplax sp. H2]
MEELYQNNFDEIRYQLISNLYARLTEQLKQNDDILQVIQALDFREGLDYGIINCHDYLALFEEDLSLYSTIKKNLLPAEISGLAASAAGFMAKRIATGLISASLSTIGAVGTGVYLGAKHIDPKERGKNFKQQLDEFISNHLKDNITRYVAAIFNQIRILYFSFNGTVESKLIHFRDQFERRWSFLNVVENKILPFNAEIDELRKKF